MNTMYSRTSAPASTRLSLVDALRATENPDCMEGRDFRVTPISDSAPREGWAEFTMKALTRETEKAYQFSYDFGRVSWSVWVPKSLCSVSLVEFRHAKGWTPCYAVRVPEWFYMKNLRHRFAQ